MGEPETEQHGREVKQPVWPGILQRLQGGESYGISCRKYDTFQRRIHIISKEAFDIFRLDGILSE